jgi:hypothetical protein
MKTRGKQWMTVAALFSFAVFAQATPAGTEKQIEDGSGSEWIYKDCVEIEAGSGGSIHVTNAKGAFIETGFSGTGIEIYAKKDAKCGTVEVYIDGNLIEQIDTSDAGNLWKAKVFEKDGLAPGKHTLKIVQTGSLGIKLDFIKVYSN